MDGLLIINKPTDWTSFDVVAKIRNKLQTKKVGHTGTLDPKATGVLVLCLGKATKLAQEITATDKEYIAEITLGATSNTDDQEGEIIPSAEGADTNPRTEEVKNVLALFTGTFEQTPPQFSAKKIKGKRAYKEARAGRKVKLDPVKVTVNELELIDYKWPIVKLRIQCGKGFYVRSLARDIGDKLEVGGYLSALQRTRVGQYDINQAVSIEEADERNIITL